MCAENEMIDWARKELKLLGESEKDMEEYCDAAFRTYCNYVKAMYGTDNPTLSSTIFNQLILGNPLTPIDDKTPDDWDFVEGFNPSSDTHNPGYAIYQCNRRFTLFKKISYDKKTGKETIKFSDSGRASCIDINTNQTYTGGIGMTLLDEIHPVTMPYYPTGKFKIFTEDFKYHKDNDSCDFDTIGVLYFKLPDGRMEEVKRFFKYDPKSQQMVEIDKTEYFARRKKVEDQKGK